MRYFGHLSSAAAVMMIVSSATLATQYNHDQDNRAAVSSEKSILWQARSNGCAEGNMPPPGANCSR
jgi:hypothetical protein